MSCNTSLIGIGKNCDPSLTNAKGLLKLYLCPTEFVSGTTLSAGTSLGGGIVTSITMSGASKFTEFVFPKLGANYTENATIEGISESVEYVQTVTATFPRREKAKRQAFIQLTAGLRNLACIVEDYNGLYWFLGYINGVNVSNLEGGSETAIYTLTLTGREASPAPEVLDTLIAGIVA